MIETINSPIDSIHASLLRNAQSAIAKIPHKLQTVSLEDRWIADRVKLQSSPTSTQSDRFSGFSPLPEQSENFLTMLPGRGQVYIKPVEELNPRQWSIDGNPRLANLISETIGDRWMTHLDDLQQLQAIATRPFFQARWQAVRRANKQVLVDCLYQTQGVRINVDSLFDVQLQPIVANQRHLLNILHIVTLFNRLKANPDLDVVPRTFIFGDVDKSATVTGRDNRLMLLLIKSLGQFLANHPDVKDRLAVVYVPHSAGLSEKIYAAADLCEQIEMAEMDDLDLNKLKFAANGVLSIGSLGHGNQIVRQAVGSDNYFSFGLAISEISLFKTYGYDPYHYYNYYPEIRQAIDGLRSGEFTPQYPGACRSILDNLFQTDENFVLADAVFYLSAQAQVSATYRQKSDWTRMSILNIAGVG